MSQQAIMMIDDESTMLMTYDTILRMQRYENIFGFTDPKRALEAAKTILPKVIVLDLMMGAHRGQDFIQPLLKASPESKVIIVSALDTIEVAVDCIRLGATDYLVKPLDQTRFSELVSTLIKQDLVDHSATISETKGESEMVFHSKIMKHVVTQSEVLARTNLPLLVTGETGTGKELMVSHLHELSQREGEFVKVNVAGFDEIMFSDSLFGHQKGAFTGALQEREGLIQKADNGTIFLDEIGDLDLRSQIKLLRLLQEGEYYPVGSDELKKTSARFVLATHADLSKKVQDGSFRQDLYYRLVSHRIHLPALRERPEDISVLSKYLVKKVSEELQQPIKVIPENILEAWESESFSGNIRELEGRIRHGVLFGFEKQQTSDFSVRSENPAFKKQHDDDQEKFLTIREATEILIDKALEKSNGKQVEAAKLLGITQQALSARLKKRE